MCNLVEQNELPSRFGSAAYGEAHSRICVSSIVSIETSKVIDECGEALAIHQTDVAFGICIALKKIGMADVAGVLADEVS